MSKKQTPNKPPHDKDRTKKRKHNDAGEEDNNDDMDINQNRTTITFKNLLYADDSNNNNINDKADTVKGGTELRLYPNDESFSFVLKRGNKYKVDIELPSGKSLKDFKWRFIKPNDGQIDLLRHNRAGTTITIFLPNNELNLL